MDMKLHQLRYLVLLASEGSIRAVARAAGVSAASVAQGLKELEDAAAVALLDRHGGGVRLSEAGLQLLPHAQQMAALLEQAQATVARLRDLQAPQKLSVGVTPWIAQTLLAPAVAAFRQEMPHVQLELFDGLSALAYPRLREGSLDLLIGRIGSQEAMRGFDVTPLFRYEMTVIARNAHPRARARSLRELLQDDWVVNFRPDERGAFIANLFGRHGLQAPAHKIHLAHSPTLMLTLVQQSDMLSFCPWPLVETMELRDKLVALPLREQFQVNTAGIVRRGQEALPPAARKFLELFRQVVQQWQASDDIRLRRVMHAVEIDPAM